MKKIFWLCSLLATFSATAQWEERTGVIVGTNEYYIGADFLFSKSGTGFTVGLVNTIPISDNSEILVEATYNRLNTDLIGRASEEADPEWLKFHTDRINVAFIYDYDIFHFFNDDLALGLCAGPTASFLNDITVSDSGKEGYLLDPYYMETTYLKIDEGSRKISFNAYATVGVSARYRNLEGSLRYNFGLTDPYRNFPGYSPYVEFKGRDSYLGFQLSYYFGDFF